MITLRSVFLGVCCAGMFLASLPVAGQGATNTLRLPVTRDTRLSSVAGETDYNFGGSSSLKLKSYQEMSLVDFDPKPLRGHVIRHATLHVHVTGAEILRRVTVSSVGAPWVEGTSTHSIPQSGASSFAARQHPNTPWAFAGSDLSAVVLGNGGTIWSTTDATLPDTGGWQQIAIDPKVLATRVARIGFGFLLFDDTGTELIRHGENVTFRRFPNRYVHSHEQHAFAPYFTIDLGPADDLAPNPPSNLTSSAGDLPAGELWLRWSVPDDRGPAGTIGFLVTINGAKVPQHLVPAIPTLGKQVRMHVRDMGFHSGQTMRVAVRAVDGAGNTSRPAVLTANVSSFEPQPLSGSKVAVPTSRESVSLPRIGDADVAIIDPLDKVDPVTGKMIPPQSPTYLTRNHLWDADRKSIQLYAAKNEIVAFQILLRGSARQVRAALLLQDKPALPYGVSRLRCVSAQTGPLPDPAVPLAAPLDVPPTDEHIAHRKNTSLLCELYVPHNAIAGQRQGTLVLQSATGQLRINVTLRIWDFTLPDYLSFLPEMNCYGLPANEGAYYRLAHVHRTVVNRLPYSQGGTIAKGCAPQWNGKKLDWSAWDRRFGPYLDGSAFAGFPRDRVPLECFYLPLHENWPLPIDQHYNGNRWADRAFDETYRHAQIEVTRQIAEHFAQRGWHDTIFQIYLNNKSSFKRKGWSRGSSPWILDEPAHFQDFWALRWFGGLYQQGLRDAPADVKMMFRCDISRPQWQRDLLDDVLDYAVVGRALRKYQRDVMDRKRRLGQIVLEYGTTNPIEASNVQPAAWCIDAWTLGCDGVLPWQTIGRADSWKKADTLSLFYPGKYVGRNDPVPSIRLKAYRRGQQDIEYLTLLAKTTKQPRWAVARQVRAQLKLAGNWQTTGFAGGEDAGRIEFSKLKPQDLWALRVQVGETLSAAAPPAQRRLVDLRVARRELAPMSQRVTAAAGSHASSDGVRNHNTASRSSHARATVTRVIQGRPHVYDVVLDPTQPDKMFGHVPRDNRLRRAETTNPLLVRFELPRPGREGATKLVRATLSLYVWDPANKARVRVGVFPVKQSWDEATATWDQATAARPWQDAATFSPRLHLQHYVDQVIVEPDSQRDIADPPAEYQWDVTALVKQWFGGAPNHGLAVLPIADRTVDGGNYVRFQVLASEYRERQYTPKLTLEFAR